MRQAHSLFALACLASAVLAAPEKSDTVGQRTATLYRYTVAPRDLPR